MCQKESVYYPLAEYTLHNRDSRTVLSIINTRILQFQGECVQATIKHKCLGLNLQNNVGLAPAYLIDLCQPVSGPGVVDPFALLRGGSGGPVCLYSGHAGRTRAFSVAGPRVWNDLPQELRLFPRLCTDTLLGHLKTYLFVCIGVGSASQQLS